MGKRPEKLKVILDTDALVSALLFGGEPGRLVSLWEKGRVVPLVSREVLLEYVRVLGYPKFSLSAEDIQALIEEHVLPFAEMVSVPRTPRIVREDPGDDKFLALAAAGRADFLISGDIHLLNLERHHGVEILTPRNFLARIESEKG
jgi:putative PIN family toxin of toxin-antitoxin system